MILEVRYSLDTASGKAFFATQFSHLILSPADRRDQRDFVTTLKLRDLAEREEGVVHSKDGGELFGHGGQLRVRLLQVCYEVV